MHKNAFFLLAIFGIVDVWEMRRWSLRAGPFCPVRIPTLYWTIDHNYLTISIAVYVSGMEIDGWMADMKWTECNLYTWFGTWTMSYCPHLSIIGHFTPIKCGQKERSSIHSILRLSLQAKPQTPQSSSSSVSSSSLLPLLLSVIWVAKWRIVLRWRIDTTKDTVVMPLIKVI